MIVIGIVGSPAGGKSTVASRLQELGATWINADLIARGVLDEQEVRTALVRRFGDKIVTKDGQIDRGRLAERVFGADDSKRAELDYLESVVHPRTRVLIHEKLAQASSGGVVATVLDVPLLFESEWDLACDPIWCVDAEFDQRLLRSAKRGWDAHELNRREANQLDLSNKRQRSTLILDNNGSLAELIAAVDENFHLISNLRQSKTNHCI
ncbi:Dephospho-CoA kinase [Rubripirellula tenax]|uniref:Dephospho-CoA kinase n=1 Tax=Rubripirellula tenax TaxID=2528015 RepID=A0A5C6EJS8_9BACT|nr:dephospho-CoA kinase [Rubripirellula tenax]TWU48665.1 Dephospho-CoA kinase [Rubripirellula tenax]